MRCQRPTPGQRTVKYPLAGGSGSVRSLLRGDCSPPGIIGCTWAEVGPGHRGPAGHRILANCRLALALRRTSRSTPEAPAVAQAIRDVPDSGPAGSVTEPPGWSCFQSCTRSQDIPQHVVQLHAFGIATALSNSGRSLLGQPSPTALPADLRASLEGRYVAGSIAPRGDLRHRGSQDLVVRALPHWYGFELG